MLDRRRRAGIQDSTSSRRAGQGDRGNRRTRVRIRTRPCRRPTGPGPDPDPAVSATDGTRSGGESGAVGAARARSGSDRTGATSARGSQRPDPAPSSLSRAPVRIVPGAPGHRISLGSNQKGIASGTDRRRSGPAVSARDSDQTWSGRIAGESGTDRSPAGSGPGRAGLREHLVDDECGTDVRATGRGDVARRVCHHGANRLDRSEDRQHDEGDGRVRGRDDARLGRPCPALLRGVERRRQRRCHSERRW
jgi:hypothetical protein